MTDWALVFYLMIGAHAQAVALHPHYGRKECLAAMDRAIREPGIGQYQITCQPLTPGRSPVWPGR
jgi:hypothetical protein